MPIAPSPLKRRSSIIVMTVIGLATALILTLGVASFAQADATSTAAMDVRVITANVDFSNSPSKVREDVNRYKPKADIIMFQEAKNVDLRNFFNTDHWKVLHNTSSKDKAGSAVAYRKSIVANQIRTGITIGTRPHGQDMLTRWIKWVDVKLANGTKLRLASLHMPPARYPGLQDNMTKNVVTFLNNSPLPVIVGGDWNMNVKNDPKNICGKTGLKSRGIGIDGFYLSAATVRFQSIKALAKGNSDHHPVRMVVRIR